MICKNCNERMEGDGYKTVLHCPSIEVPGVEPDANPVYCTGETGTGQPVASPKKRGRPVGVTQEGSQADVLLRMKIGGVAYFEFNIAERTAQSFAQQIQAVIHREVGVKHPGRRYSSCLFTCVPMGKAGDTVRYAFRVERTA